MGQTHGAAFRTEITNFVRTRLRAARAYAWERGFRDDEQNTSFLRTAEQCLAVFAEWHPEGYAEHCGMAAGAEVSPIHLYAATNMTDLRDTWLYHDYDLSPTAEDDTDSEGCTTALLPRACTADNVCIGSQTWDLNPTDIDFVLGVHRLPNNGPETWSITLMGCLSLCGMNEHGIATGTNNIRTNDAQTGIGYMSLLHKTMTAQTRDEVYNMITNAPRSGAHNYWCVDADDGFQLECSAQQHREYLMGTDPLFHTNHCLDDYNCSIQTEVSAESTTLRLQCAQNAIHAHNQHTPQTLVELFADRSDGVNSINRLPEDDQGTTTNSCIICIPERLEMHACRGPSDRGEWVQLPFDRVKK